MLLLDAGNTLPVIKSSHVVRTHWSDHYGIMATLIIRPSASLAAGVVLGHAIGDAVGTAYEFSTATKTQKLTTATCAWSAAGRFT
jgi:cyanophycinase-like exopeptidase